ncbi:TetR/AcrR family transcriptional regulator C-terminal ligand-binding domain-containing protein [Rhodococcus ruber]|uniref:TetR/AcrR family transcriptional regulator C-terminal ligand-binding domain-containing protein n=1 Tax=Rhodococcus ruber TaxID=1830 RepID=A0ABT4MKM7_9NOCA|nr:TetR/AcrR family transcriptional regulator [Rhodococcus ruber]MCZ4521544.1 TetR/AcrR family transcriptional regulator C-terminal ligand-binding domain-containing protein [Rhodococcus ruber]
MEQTPTDPEVRRRPGGRAAQVTEAVHEAVLAAVVEVGVDKVGIPDISRRAGVRDTTIYRRWVTRENLILDVLLTGSERTLVVPDTGTLRDDLTSFATALDGYLESAVGQGLLRVFASITDSPEIAESRKMFWQERFRSVAVVFERASARGETAADVDARAAIELLIAPIHFRHLLSRQPCDREFVDSLVSAVIGYCETAS